MYYFNLRVCIFKTANLRCFQESEALHNICASVPINCHKFIKSKFRRIVVTLFTISTNTMFEILTTLSDEYTRIQYFGFEPTDFLVPSRGLLTVSQNDTSSSGIFRILIFASTTELEFSVNLHHFSSPSLYFVFKNLFLAHSILPILVPLDWLLLMCHQHTTRPSVSGMKTCVRNRQPRTMVANQAYVINI